MGFKILYYKHRGASHEWGIRGDGPWGLLDMLPYMLQVSKRSKDYGISAAGTIFDKRTDRHSEIKVSGTISPNINKVNVFDTCIGAQMIRKYITSVETPLPEGSSDNPF